MLVSWKFLHEKSWILMHFQKLKWFLSSELLFSFATFTSAKSAYLSQNAIEMIYSFHIFRVKMLGLPLWEEANIVAEARFCLLLELSLPDDLDLALWNPLCNVECQLWGLFFFNIDLLVKEPLLVTPKPSSGSNSGPWPLAKVPLFFELLLNIIIS